MIVATHSLYFGTTGKDLVYIYKVSVIKEFQRIAALLWFIILNENTNITTASSVIRYFTVLDS